LNFEGFLVSKRVFLKFERGVLVKNLFLRLFFWLGAKVLLIVVVQIVQEKARFKNCPVNFAAKKTELMKEKEMAMNK
jgi:hypothetical protein